MNEMVFMNNGKVATSSRVVAEHFGMTHKNVLQALDNKKGTAENSALLNSMYFETTYTTTQNKQVREVLMNRDGFSLLAMGFTGAKALEFQLEFIQEFNRMEEELRNKTMPQTYISALEAFLESEKQKEQLRIEAEQLAVALIEAKPKVTYYDLILRSTDLMTIRLIAQDYGISASKLNNILYDNKIQYKDGKTWYLYSKYKGQGYVQTQSYPYIRLDGSTGAKVHTSWTQKGRLLIHELMTNLGHSVDTDIVKIKEV